MPSKAITKMATFIPTEKCIHFRRFVLAIVELSITYATLVAMKKGVLHLYVFCTGAAVLALELSASRLLAPYFGTSLFVWGNILGIVLAALACGYWFGGRLADRSPRVETLGFMTWGAGLAASAIPLISPLILRNVTSILSGFPLFLIVASFAAMLLLFALPLALLGAVSPMAVKIGTADVGEVGSVSGSLSAAATAGSLFGAFIPAFLTIPLLGTRFTILASGAVMIALGAAAMGKRRAFLGLLLPLTLLLSFPKSAAAWEGVIYERESPYQYIRVIERNDRRYLITNEGFGIQNVSLDENGLTGTYSDGMAALPFMLDGERPIRVLMIGVAGGSIIRQIRHFMPADADIHIDAVDIDPEMPKVAEAFFGLRPEDADITVADGRQFLLDAETPYDLIIVDAFKDELYTPFHLMSREFFRLARQRLSPDGFLAINIIGDSGPSSLPRYAEETVRSEFARTYVTRLDDSKNNHLIIGAIHEPRWAGLAEAPEALRPSAMIISQNRRTVVAQEHLLTDDRAPVEWLTDGFVWRLSLRIRQGD